MEVFENVRFSVTHDLTVGESLLVDLFTQSTTILKGKWKTQIV